MKRTGSDAAQREGAAAAPPRRPAAVSAAAGLLLGAAVALLAGWIIWPEQVSSNGARVFFIMLWVLFAHACMRGFGWVRFAIATIFGASLWGAWNSGAFANGLATQINAQDAVCRAMQAAAFVLLCLPVAGRWFAAAAARRE